MSICDDLFHHYCLLLLLWPVHLWWMKKPIRDALFRSNKCITRDTWRFGWSSLWVICDAFSLVYDESNLSCIREFLVVIISFCFHLYLMLYACVVRFDVTKNLEKFLVKQKNQELRTWWSVRLASGYVKRKKISPRPRSAVSTSLWLVFGDMKVKNSSPSARTGRKSIILVWGSCVPDWWKKTDADRPFFFSFNHFPIKINIYMSRCHKSVFRSVSPDLSVVGSDTKVTCKD